MDSKLLRIQKFKKYNFCNFTNQQFNELIEKNYSLNHDDLIIENIKAEIKNYIVKKLQNSNKYINEFINKKLKKISKIKFQKLLKNSTKNAKIFVVRG